MFGIEKTKRKNEILRGRWLIVLSLMGVAGWGLALVLQLRSAAPRQPWLPTQAILPTEVLGPTEPPPPPPHPTSLPIQESLPILTAPPTQFPWSTPVIEWPLGTMYYMDDIEKRVYAFNLQTQIRVSVPSYPALDGQVSAATSPDGQWHAFWEHNADYRRYDLILEPTRTRKQERTLGAFYLSDTTLSWSSDNQWLLINAYPQADITQTVNAEVWMVNRETGEVRQLTDGSAPASSPYFSPRGTHLAYLSQGTLWVMERDSREQHLVLPTGARVTHFVWSYDGDWLAYTLMPPEKPEQPQLRIPLAVDIFGVRVADSKVELLISTTRVNHVVGWLP